MRRPSWPLMPSEIRRPRHLLPGFSPIGGAPHVGAARHASCYRIQVPVQAKGAVMSARRVIAVGARAVVLLVTWTAPVLALDPQKALTQYVHNAWQTDHGLPQNSVQAVLQTRDGYLWFGTQEGLVRFDGEHFEIFDRSNTAALGHNDVTALLEDRLGRLWVGTNGFGLTWLKDGVFTRFTAQNPLSDEFVTALCEDSRGTMWIGTKDHGILGFADGQVRSVTTSDGLSSNRVLAIHEDRSGDLWVGTSDGLNRLRGRTITRFSIAVGRPTPGSRRLPAPPVARCGSAPTAACITSPMAGFRTRRSFQAARFDRCWSIAIATCGSARAAAACRALPPAA